MIVYLKPELPGYRQRIFRAKVRRIIFVTALCVAGVVGWILGGIAIRNAVGATLPPTWSFVSDSAGWLHVTRDGTDLGRIVMGDYPSEHVTWFNNGEMHFVADTIAKRDFE